MELKTTNKMQKHEPIIWTPESCPFENFLQATKGVRLEYIIYVQDCSGCPKSVWACTKEDFVKCMFTISELNYFGRLQSINDAIQFGF